MGYRLNQVLSYEACDMTFSRVCNFHITHFTLQKVQNCQEDQTAKSLESCYCKKQSASYSHCKSQDLRGIDLRTLRDIYLLYYIIYLLSNLTMLGFIIPESKPRVVSEGEADITDSRPPLQVRSSLIQVHSVLLVCVQ